MPSSILTDTAPTPEQYLPFFRPSQQAAEIGECSFDLVVALAAKGFVILTGQSGTGKSRSALRLGQGLDGLDEYDSGIRGSSYELVPVGADWTDARPLIGYTNPFGAPRQGEDGETTHLTYETPDALRLMLRAASPSNAQKWAKEAIEEAVANDLENRKMYVLRPDGDTDVYSWRVAAQGRGSICHRRECGWITLGNVVSPSDMPCIIFA